MCIRDRLWPLSPTTFSGGEQQRVNIARGFAHGFPALLLDEPTASLDAANRGVVLTLIDLTLAANLLLIVLFSGYENFVSKFDFDTGADRPG